MNKNPNFKEAFFVFLQVAAYSFGGPANQIAVMHRLLVDEKQWIDEKQFLNALNYCMLLPGPEAHQLIIYIGWLLHRVRGGVAAGLLFVLPGFLSILLLSILYVNYQSTKLVQVIFYGIKPAVIAIVLSALIRISRKSLKSKSHYIIALFAFVALFLFNLPFPIVILSAALIGYLLHRFNLAFSIDNEKTINQNLHTISFSTVQLIKTSGVWLAIWLLPVFLIFLIAGVQHVFTQEAFLFSKTAILSFGGAYAVLSYIAQQAVQTYGWLRPVEMLDGLGMAETTPGPLIQVVQFVGFLAAYRYAGGMSPLLAGILGSIITTWVTFAPSFLWIFVGAPYIEQLRKIQTLHVILTAITAAIVGVILNLSLWFAINTLFSKVDKFQMFIFDSYQPIWSTFDYSSAFIMLVALILTFHYKAGIFLILLTGIFLGSIINSIF
ncbi:TPA: chromate efflux transporter [Legionella pneumophila]|nr:chromate efflux transporter [Legionella pneumophila]HAT1882794.1 chromate efflux transporter [Legionella pneumophila]HAT2114165.1 chromate efflux transporter [Legionella pneumophila]HAT8720956.1 chromate efflux transporter [Legionella pneumophila]